MESFELFVDVGNTEHEKLFVTEETVEYIELFE